MDLSGAFVGAQTEERRVPEATLGGPLDEPYLRHQLRLHPLHLPHLVSHHAAAPAGRLRVRQIDERVMVGVQGLQRLEDLTAQVRHEAVSGPDSVAMVHLLVRWRLPVHAPYAW